MTTTAAEEAATTDFDAESGNPDDPQAVIADVERGLRAESRTEDGAGLQPEESKCLEFTVCVILTALNQSRGDEHRVSLTAVIGTALELLPSDALLVGVVDVLSLTKYHDRFRWALDRDLEAKIRRARANCLEVRAEQWDRAAEHESAGEARAMAAANRRAAHAITSKVDPSVEIRESWRTTRMALNRRRRDFGLRLLPVPSPLRRLYRPHGVRPRAREHCGGARRARARSTAPTRGDPDLGDEPPSHSPLPIGGGR